MALGVYGLQPEEIDSADSGTARRGRKNGEERERIGDTGGLRGRRFVAEMRSASRKPSATDKNPTRQTKKLEAARYSVLRPRRFVNLQNDKPTARLPGW